MNYIIALILAYFIYWWFQRSKQKKQLKYIEDYPFPRPVREKLSQKYPHLQEEELDEVIEGLRDYFYIVNKGNGKMVAMPSQAVDYVWHEFILYTRLYNVFSFKAFAKFLHHTPPEEMNGRGQKAIKLAWKLLCEKEKITANYSLRRPTLFDLDTKLHIPNGFRYNVIRTGTDSSETNNDNDDYTDIDIDLSDIFSSSSSSSSSDSSDSSCGGGCGGGGD